jgi:hypothetical protein
MPATTPNRGYPYSIAADPVDIPGDLQRLAEAIDTDVSALTASIPLRPAIRFRGTEAIAAVTFQPLNPGEDLPFDIVDFDTGLPYLISGDHITIRPQLAGFYYMIATVAIPRPTSGASRNGLGVRIRKNTITATANINHLQPSASDGIRTGSVRTGLHMNGTTDALTVEFASTLPTAGLDQYTVTERTLTLIRMSPTFP